ncbi:MAG TPA: aldose 1-epimerase family protein [Anaerolineaceae bacterium]|nr:aldose 1-epimerase family protein [Anaerolineaceae bacterium]
MSTLYGRDWSRTELLCHIGELSQIAGWRLSELMDGVERGNRVAEFRSGGGLNFSVMLDRGMDIGDAEYCSVPLAWLSMAGFVAPSFFEPEGLGWLRTFGGGLLTGCGMTYLGSPSEDDGEKLGLHGRLSVTPTSHVQFGEEWEGDECTFWLKGQVRQARMFGENLLLKREISVGLGGTKISLHDRVENLADSLSPLMILYHINLGFPMLNESCYLEAEAHNIKPRDKDAELGIENWHHFQRPTLGFREQAFYHDLPAASDGWAQMNLLNPDLRLKLSVRFEKTGLPNLIQWKMMGNKTYVLGLEPANCLVEGRQKERERGTLQFIQPGEKKDFRIEISVLKQ